MNEALHGPCLSVTALAGSRTYHAGVVQHTVVLEEYARTLVARSASISAVIDRSALQQIQDRFTWEIDAGLRTIDNRSHQTLSYSFGGPGGITVICARQRNHDEYGAALRECLPFLQLVTLDDVTARNDARSTSNPL